MAKDITGSLLQSISKLYNSIAVPKISVIVAGGGVQALQFLFSVPGASKCLQNGEIPYSNESLKHLLRNNVHVVGNTDPRCTKETALLMAKVAHSNCLQFLLAGPTQNDLKTHNNEILGISCTAALISSMPRRGSHRCHVGIHSSKGKSSVYSLFLNKGKRDRLGEDHVCSRLIIDVLLKHAGSDPGPDSLLREAIEKHSSDESEDPEEIVVHRSFTVAEQDSLDRIYSKSIKQALYIPFDDNGSDKSQSPLDEGSLNSFRILEDSQIPADSIIYPGSFNPLHDGHLSLVSAELQRLREVHEASGSSQPFTSPWVLFELSALNADKPPLAREELIRRLRQFSSENSAAFVRHGISKYGLCVTTEPLFEGKSKLFPGSKFIIGADTLARLLQPKYYTSGSTVPLPNGANTIGSEKLQLMASMMAMTSALTRIAQRGCRFVVGGRVRDASASAANGDSGKATPVFETGDMLLSQIQRDFGRALLASESSSGETGPLLPLPTAVLDMFVHLPESKFRLDISSTELRKKLQSTNL